MSVDTSTLPVSPVFIIAVSLYAATMALLGGPTVISRELARDDWHAQCQSDLTAAIEANRQPVQLAPAVPNLVGLLCGLYPELGDLCELIPDPNAALRASQTQLHTAEQARLRQAVSETAMQCTCAQHHYIESNRLSLALYAGSGRLIVPVAVSGRDAALSRAANSSFCSPSLGGRS